MNTTYIIGKLCLTTTIQAHGAPLLDTCFTREKLELGSRSFKGKAILLTPWKRDKYGDSLPQRALVIAWQEKP